MSTIGAALAGLLMLAEQSGSTIGSRNDIGPRYHRYDFESRCGAAVFKVRFQNGPGTRSRVDHVLVDGGPVPGAAKTLDRIAARGVIDRIEIIHCGKDAEHLLFWGVMELTKSESQPAGRQNRLYFHLVRKNKGWRFSVDRAGDGSP